MTNSNGQPTPTQILEAIQNLQVGINQRFDDVVVEIEQSQPHPDGSLDLVTEDHASNHWQILSKGLS